MAGSMAIVAGGLGGLAAAGGAAAAHAAALRRRRPYLPGSHAERDPHRRDPLAAALRWGFASLEVSAFLGEDGELYLGEPGHPEAGRTLRSAVLEPLAARVDATGRIYPGQAEPLSLLVELATPAPQVMWAYQALDAQLRAHASMLTRWDGGHVVPGAVTVILTGGDCQRHLLAAQPGRYAFADGTFDDVDSWAAPAALVPLVSEHWAWRFGWDGTEPMAAEERHLLRGLVRAAHADGRRVRFFGVPERPRAIRRAFWQELAAAGVDLIGGRNLGGLARFLRGSGSARRAGRAWRWYAMIGA